MVHSPPPPRLCLGAEECSPSVAGPMAASWAFETEEVEDEAEHVQLYELVEAEGAELTDGKIGIKEHQDDNNAGCKGDREPGEGGTSSAGNSDYGRDGDDYHDLRSLLAKISLAICYDLRYSATGMFWDYTTLIFGLSRRGREAETGHIND